MKTICIDFDGVIADFSNGWQGWDKFGPVMPGAREATMDLRRRGWKIIIFTCRPDTPGLRTYLDNNGIEYDSVNINVENFEGSNPGKPFADVYLDDRAIRFSSWYQAMADIEGAAIMEDANMTAAERQTIKQTISDRMTDLTSREAGLSLKDKRDVQKFIYDLRAKLAAEPATDRVVDPSILAFMKDDDFQGYTPLFFLASIKMLLDRTGDIESLRDIAKKYMENKYGDTYKYASGGVKPEIDKLSTAKSYADIYGIISPIVTRFSGEFPKGMIDAAIDNAESVKKLKLLVNDPSADPDDIYDLAVKAKRTATRRDGGFKTDVHIAAGISNDDIMAAQAAYEQSVSDIYSRHTTSGNIHFSDIVNHDDYEKYLDAKKKTNDLLQEMYAAADVVRLKKELEYAPHVQAISDIVKRRDSDLDSIIKKRNAIRDTLRSSGPTIGKEGEATKEYDLLTQQYQSIVEKAKNDMEPYQQSINKIIDQYSSESDKAIAPLSQKMKDISAGVQNATEIYKPVLDSLLDHSPITKDQAADWVKNYCIIGPAQKAKLRDNKYPIEVFKEDCAEFYRLTRGRLVSVEFINTRSERAFARIGTGQVAISAGFNKTTLFHEMAHILESDPKSKDLSAKFLAVKTKDNGGQVKYLKELQPLHRYKEDEKAMVDTFIDPYVGKVYRDGITEVFSMGVQMFTSPEQMSILKEKDHEHYNFIVGFLLRGPKGSSLESIGEKKSEADAKKIKTDGKKELIKRIDKAMAKIPDLKEYFKELGYEIVPYYRGGSYGKKKPSGYNIEWNRTPSLYGSSTVNVEYMKSEKAANRTAYIKSISQAGEYGMFDIASAIGDLDKMSDAMLADINAYLNSAGQK